MTKTILISMTAALGLTMTASAQTCVPEKWNANRTDLDFLVTITQTGLELGDIYAVHPLRWHPAFMSKGYDERIEWVFRALAVDERQGRYVTQMAYLEETRVKLGGRPSEYNEALYVQLQPPVEIYRSAGSGY